MQKLADISAFESLGSAIGTSDVSIFNAPNNETDAWVSRENSRARSVLLDKMKKAVSMTSGAATTILDKASRDTRYGVTRECSDDIGALQDAIGPVITLGDKFLRKDYRGLSGTTVPTTNGNTDKNNNECKKYMVKMKTFLSQSISAIEGALSAAKEDPEYGFSSECREEVVRLLKGVDGLRKAAAGFQRAAKALYYN